MCEAFAGATTPRLHSANLNSSRALLLGGNSVCVSVCRPPRLKRRRAQIVGRKCGQQKAGQVKLRKSKLQKPRIQKRCKIRISTKNLTMNKCTGGFGVKPTTQRGGRTQKASQGRRHAAFEQSDKGSRERRDLIHGGVQVNTKQVHHKRVIKGGGIGMRAGCVKNRGINVKNWK